MRNRWWMAQILREIDGGAGGGAAPASAPATPAAGAAAPPVVAFAEQLPADIRGEAVFRDIKDLDGLAKGYLHAQKLIGRDPKSVLPIPAADDQAAWSEVYAKLGRPEAPEKYAFPDVKLPEGLAIDQTLQTGFAKVAHDLGLSQAQAEKLYGWYNSATGEMFTGQQLRINEARTQAEHALKSEWGAAFDKNIQLASLAVDHYGGEELRAALPAEMQNNPALVKMFAKLGAQLSEDGVLGKSAGGFGDALSPGEAQQQISAKQADPKFMSDYMDKRAPGHAAAVETMQRLYQFAHPG